MEGLVICSIVAKKPSAQDISDVVLVLQLSLIDRKVGHLLVARVEGSLEEVVDEATFRCVGVLIGKLAKICAWLLRVADAGRTRAQLVLSKWQLGRRYDSLDCHDIVSFFVCRGAKCETSDGAFIGGDCAYYILMVSIVKVFFTTAWDCPSWAGVRFSIATSWSFGLKEI